jgi:methylphosphotriester-DNA--protein-cysteine methyltransferase
MVDRTRVNSQLNCEQVWHEISNYVEGEVDATLRTGMDEHFRTCKRCASVLEGTRNVIRLYGDERMIEERTIEVPAGFGRRLEKRLAQNARAGRRRWSSWSAWLVPVAALALITAGVWLTNSWTIARQERSQMAAVERNIPPDMKVVIADGGKIFHVASCDLIRNKENVRTLTAKEAIQQGYTPCLRCLRKYVDTTAAVGHTELGTVADSRDADADEEKHEGGQ